MFYTVVYDSDYRVRLSCGKSLLSKEQACGIAQLLNSIDGVSKVDIRSANGSILICCPLEVRAEVYKTLDGLSVDNLPEATQDETLEIAAIDNQFQMKVLNLIVRRAVKKLIIPLPIRRILIGVRSVKFAYRGIQALMQGKINVDVLDAVAVSVAFAQGQPKTASSVMFMLKISDILAEYTQARTRFALRQNMMLFAEKVWVVRDGIEVEVPIEEVQLGEVLRVSAGSLVPLDGEVVDGEAELNEASMTGESALVPKRPGSIVFAGTAVDEGSLLVKSTALAGESRIDAIVDMVENSQELKAGVQSRAEELADAIVPFSLGMFALVLAVTRSPQRAMSVLMVDFSCAIKLSVPIAVMSAMREATRKNVLVKGGKYMEALARTDAIVFDKTGTLTSACPQVVKTIPFGEYTEKEVLRLAACLEEHYPHSVARAIVSCAKEENLVHLDEKHADVEYIVAHGLASTLDSKRALIGSEHFVFEDEEIPRPDNMREVLDQEVGISSTVYLAIGGELVGAICISDPVRPEAKGIIDGLRERGFKQIVMLTGDSENCAAAVSNELGLDTYHSQVLPEDKARYVEELKDKGYTVAMVGDGINDSPALAAANVSLAMSDASDIARTVADVSIMESSLDSILSIRDLSTQLMKRIDSSYKFVVGFNSALIALGLVGLVPPTTAAMLHNSSTVLLAASNTRTLMPSDKNEDDQ